MNFADRSLEERSARTAVLCVVRDRPKISMLAALFERWGCCRVEGGPGGTVTRALIKPSTCAISLSTLRLNSTRTLRQSLAVRVRRLNV